MQLKKISIRNKLAIATSTLLLSTPAQSVEANPPTESDFNDDNFSISGLYYSEEDRVEVNKVQAKIKKTINEDHEISVDLIYDTMSGASPNGRIVTDTNNSDSVTITTASGFKFNANSSSNSANSKPWLTQFQDTRKAASLDWSYKATRTFTTIFGAAASTENDYESYSASGNIVYEFNQKRSTLNMGAAISNDRILAIGGIPEGLGLRTCIGSPAFQPDWLDCDTMADVYKPAEKIVTDYMIGITQVWNRRTLLQFNYSMGNENGYLTDPYKQISVYDSSFGETAILYEKRPNIRNTNSLFFKIVNVPMNDLSINFSYRYFWDDWDIAAHTLDGRLRFNLGSRFYIQGHGRVHQQSEAFFFDTQIGASENDGSYYADKPNYISADSRLSKMISATAGIKIGVKYDDDIDFSARVEHMQQHYYSGVLPRLKVWIAQLILNIKF